MPFSDDIYTKDFEDLTEAEQDRVIRTPAKDWGYMTRKFRVQYNVPPQIGKALTLEECWKLRRITRPIPGFDWHTISRKGNVYCLYFGPRTKYGRTMPFRLTQTADEQGYRTVRMPRVSQDSPQTFKVHLLTALAWIGEPPALESSVLFRDGNRMNCRVENLYYGTEQDAEADEEWRATFGAGPGKPIRPFHGWLELISAEQVKRGCQWLSRSTSQKLRREREAMSKANAQ